MEKSEGKNESHNKKKTEAIHLLIFPFPLPGHIIPLLDLTRRLLTRRHHRLTVTVIVTPSSLSLLQPLLQSFPSSSLQPLLLSPPPDSGGLISRVRSIRALSDPIISWFRCHPSPPHALIADLFLGWTHSLCSDLRLPRVVFYPCGAFGCSVLNSMWRCPATPSNPTGDGNFEVRFDDIPGSPRFKWCELSALFRARNMDDPDWESFRQELVMNVLNWGAIFNSLSELEPLYLDHFKKEMGHDRVWAVGPLLPDAEAAADLVVQRGGPSSVSAQEVLTWLDGRLGCSVVYVCFGTQVSLTKVELGTLGAALECSKVHFIWCIPESEGEREMVRDSEYEDRVADRGFVIRGWAPQLAILRHKAVAAFLTHCGWNSVLESVASGVMMLAWPLGTDQYLNAQLIVGQLGLGLQVPRHGAEGVPDPGELAQLLTDSVSLDRVERGRVMRLREVAAFAVSDGSSTVNLDSFVESLDRLKQ